MENEQMTWGDEMTKETKYCRIVLMNINGIRDKTVDLGIKINEYNINIIGIVETNMNWSWKSNKMHTQNILRRVFQQSAFSFSNSAIQFNSHYQPGGTLSVAGDKWASRSNTSNDPNGKGRWSTITIRGRHDTFVTIYTVYRVCDQSFSSSGTKTAFRQQHIMGALEGLDPNNPREKVLQDLTQAIKNTRTAKHAIIVLIDANESTDTYRSSIATWLTHLKMIDPIVIRHGSEDQPPSIATGSERIDYIFTSKELLPYIQYVGILPHNAIVDSDHRPLFMDIDLEKYLQGLPVDNISHKGQSVHSDTPKAVKKYQEELSKSLSNSKIEDELDFLTDQQEQFGQLVHQQISLAKRCDHQVASFKVKAEQKCTRIRKTPFSPELKHAQCTLTYWYNWLKQYNKKKDTSKARLKARPDLETVYTTQPVRNVISRKLREAQKKFRAIVRNTKEIRSAHNRELAEMYSNKGNVKVQSHILQIERKEQMSDMLRQIYTITQKPKHKPITQILIPNDDGTLRTINDRQRIDEAFLKRNIAHFSQADGTPFASHPLSTTYGPYGTNEASTRLLNGIIEVDTSTLSDATKSILKHIPLQHVPPLDYKMHTRELIISYNRWRENTTTSPFGDHLGLDKAIMRRIIPANENSDETHHLEFRIFKIRSQLLNLALENCIVYDRWNHIINTMIEKIPGKPLIDKFRVIHIIANDYNMMMGILFGHRLMQQAELLQQFGEEQRGARRGKDCQDVQTLKHIIFSILRMSRSNGSTFDNDAKSCYDRIVMLLPSLLAQRMGMPKHVCNLLLETLLSAEYSTKTGHGISKSRYSTTAQYHIHGSGQGSRSSPAIWTVISCFILSLMAERSTGVTLTDPEQTTVVHQTSSGFVDDITHWNINIKQSVTSPETKDQLINTTTITAQWWENLLHSTGGKLELSKCFYYAIHWTFDDYGTPILAPATSFLSEIQLKDSSTGIQTAIEHKDCTESHKTLGKMENPSGDYTDEHIRLKQKSDIFAHKIISSTPTRSQALYIYRAMYLTSIGYGFASGTLSLKQAEKTQTQFTMAILPPMGYNRCFPRAVVYAAPELGGTGLHHLLAEQGSRQITSLLHHIRNNTNLGKAAIIQLKWAQKLSGMSTPILEDPATKIPMFNKEWGIKALRQFLRLSFICIEINGIEKKLPKRGNDQYIMDIVLRHPSYAPKTKRAINACRLYMQVETLSDITRATGRFLSEEATNCIRTENQQPNILWPRQPKPEKIEIWQKFLKTLCSNNDFKLTTPLEAWISPPIKCLWKAYYNVETEQIIAEIDDEWMAATNINKQRFRDKWEIPFLQPLPTTPKLGRTYIPISIQRKINPRRNLNGNHINNITHAAEFGPEYITPQPYWVSIPTKPNYERQTALPTWNDFIKSKPRWQHTFLRHTENIDASLDQPLWQTLLDPTKIIIITSDGSQKGIYGSYCWALGTNHHNFIHKSGQVGGNPITPFCTEAIGILAWIVYLTAYCEFYQLEPTSTITPYSDNTSAIKYLSKDPLDYKDNLPLRKDYDATVSIHHMYKQLCITCTKLKHGQHVKAHQSNENPTIQEQLHSVCDTKAKEVRRHNATVVPQALTINPIRLISQKKVVTGRENAICLWSWRNECMFEYYTEKFGLSILQVRNINWKGYALAIKKLSSSMKLFANKLVTRWLPVATRVHLYGNELQKCHLCTENETPDHIFQCQHASRRAASEERFTNCCTYLNSIKTPRPISLAIASGIFAWTVAPSEDIPK